MEILRSTAILSSITGQEDMDTAGAGNEELLEEEVDSVAPAVKEAESASKSSRMSESHRQASPDSAQHQFIGNGSIEMAGDHREPDESAGPQEVDQIPSPGEVEASWGEFQVMGEHGHHEKTFLPENSMPLSSQSLRGTVDRRGRSKALSILRKTSTAFQKDQEHASSRYGSTSSGTRPLSIFTDHKRERKSDKYALDHLNLEDSSSSPSSPSSPRATSIPAPSVYSEREDKLSPVSSPYVPLVSITILKLTCMNSGSAIDTDQHTIDDLKHFWSDQGNDSSELALDQFYPSPLQSSSWEGPQEGTTVQPQSGSFHRQGVQSGSRSSTVIHEYRSETSSQEVGVDTGLDLWSQLGHTIMSPQHTVNTPAGSSGGMVSTALHRPIEEMGNQARQLENTSKGGRKNRDWSDSEEVPSKRHKSGPKLSFGVSVSGVSLQAKKAHKK
jgi:hypothetical protein